MPLTFEGVFTLSGEGRRGSRRGEGFPGTFPVRREEPFAVTGLSAVTWIGEGGDTKFWAAPLCLPLWGVGSGPGAAGGPGRGGRRGRLAPVWREEMNVSVRGGHVERGVLGKGSVSLRLTDGLGYINTAKKKKKKINRQSSPRLLQLMPA